MDEKEAEARPVMGTIFLVIMNVWWALYIAYQQIRNTRLGLIIYNIIVTQKPFTVNEKRRSMEDG